MTKYVLTYSGGNHEMSSDPKAVEAVMATWGAWFGSIGEALVDGGNPFSTHATVGPDGTVTNQGNANPNTGYSIINAADLAAASKIAQSCPVLANGGTVDVNEAIEM